METISMQLQYLKHKSNFLFCYLLTTTNMTSQVTCSLTLYLYLIDNHLAYLILYRVNIFQSIILHNKCTGVMTVSLSLYAFSHIN